MCGLALCLIEVADNHLAAFELGLFVLCLGYLSSSLVKIILQKNSSQELVRGL